MPEVFRKYGYSFFFYSREHEPVHIHIEGKGGFAKYSYDGVLFVMNDMEGIKEGDRRKIEDCLEANKKLIIDKWYSIFYG